MLAHKVLAAMVAEAEQLGDATVLRPLEMLSERMGPADVPQWLQGPTADAQALLRPPPLNLIEAGPSMSMGG